MRTDGRVLVVVQRTDLDLKKDAPARALAIADNRVAELDLNWDSTVLEQLRAQGVDLCIAKRVNTRLVGRWSDHIPSSNCCSMVLLKACTRPNSHRFP